MDAKHAYPGYIDTTSSVPAVYAPAGAAGMSMRAWLAGQALSAVWVEDDVEIPMSPEKHAKAAVALADATLELLGVGDE